MLRIIADDLGLAESVNDGTVFLLKEGKINGASLMANGEAFDDAVRKLKDLPDANIGIHLVLVEERPLTHIKLPKNHKTFFVKYLLGLIKKNKIEKECDAQIKKILESGVNLQFINSHQHLHLLPGIIDITISLAKKYGIPYIRIVKESLGSKGGLARKTQLIFLNFLSLMAKKKIIKAGLGHNDYFVGFINAGNLNLSDLASAIKLQKKHPDKFIELGCHPGFESPKLIDKYKHWGKYRWRKEIEVLSK